MSHDDSRAGAAAVTCAGGLAVIAIAAVLLDRASAALSASHLGAVLVITPEMEAILLARGAIKPAGEKPPITAAHERYLYREVEEKWLKAAKKLAKELAQAERADASAEESPVASADASLVLSPVVELVQADIAAQPLAPVVEAAPEAEADRTRSTIGVHQLVRELPDALRAALKSVGYGKADIEILTSETESLFDAGGEGRRAFVVLVDLATGRTQHQQGSWGGANIFNPGNAVDLDQNEYRIPPGGAVIKGNSGYGGTLATITLNPANVIKALPEGDPLSPMDRKVMAAMQLKSSYRAAELERAGATQDDVDSLIERGFLARSKSGAVSTTLAGKNTRKAGPGSGRW